MSGINPVTSKDEKTKYDKEKIKNILKKTLIGTSKNLLLFGIFTISIFILFTIYTLLDAYIGYYASRLYFIILIIFFINLIVNLE